MNLVEHEVHLADMRVSLPLTVDTLLCYDENNPGTSNQDQLHVHIESEESCETCSFEPPIRGHVQIGLIK